LETSDPHTQNAQQTVSVINSGHACRVSRCHCPSWIIIPRSVNTSTRWKLIRCRSWCRRVYCACWVVRCISIPWCLASPLSQPF